jgi:hypothetical protein
MVIQHKFTGDMGNGGGFQGVVVLRLDADEQCNLHMFESRGGRYHEFIPRVARSRFREMAIACSGERDTSALFKISSANIPIFPLLDRTEQ